MTVVCTRASYRVSVLGVAGFDPKETRAIIAAGYAIGGPPTAAARPRQWTPVHFQADAGTTMSSAGTSVFTDTCGQVSLAKFSRTVCEY